MGTSSYHKEIIMNTRVQAGRWGRASVLLGVGLAGVLFAPVEGRADPGPGTYLSQFREHKRDFAGRTFHALLRDQMDLNLSPEQVGAIEDLAKDYAKTRIRDEAEVQLAEVDAFALIENQQSDLAAIETALHKSESAKTTARLDRVKAIRAATAVLTPEQHEMWRIRTRERHWEGRHGRACASGARQS
jgi:Spy/CpxP family protein refolding chaperone